MKKLNLQNITLFCLDSVNHDKAFDALNRCCEAAWFGDIRFLQSKSMYLDDYIHPVTDKRQYSYFILKNLTNYVKTDFVLIVQHDGFIVNPDAWTDEFLQYDYIGAPWWYNDRLNVGNGGFSLRSKRLIDICAQYSFDQYMPEDDVISRRYRHDLEKMGLKWAPEELAARFSWEGNAKYPRYNGSFGFHGKSNIKLFQS